MADDEGDREIRRAHGSSGEPIEVGLARELSELAREMQAEPDLIGGDGEVLVCSRRGA